MRLVGDAHGLSTATVSRCAHNVVNILNRTYFNAVIRWPNNCANISQKFYQKAGMPSVIGCVDGTHIPIKTPTEDEVQYVNRHGDHSINCMMVTGKNKK